jgi:hypothetical protein
MEKRDAKGTLEFIESRSSLDSFLSPVKPALRPRNEEEEMNFSYLD